MVLQRSPSNKDDLGETPIEYPSRILANLTRKANEIRGLIAGKQADVDEIRSQLGIYHERRKEFIVACQPALDVAAEEGNANSQVPQFLLWYDKQTNNIVDFVAEIQKWLEPFDLLLPDIRPNDSASQYSAKSKALSKCSATSSLRAKLAEQRAQTAAKKEMADKRKDQVQKKVALQMKLAELKAQQELEQANEEELELEEQLRFQDNLERELSKLEGNPGIESNLGTQPDRNANENKTEFSRQPIVQSVSGNSRQKSQTPSSNANNDLADVVVALAKSHIKSTLPKTEPEIFNGEDATLFKTFMKAFQEMIADCCETDSQRFYYLEKYTTGLPKELVKSCENENPSVGYKSAIKMLNREFGDERVIATAYLEKLRQFKEIKNEDAKALRKFAFFLLSCANMMSSVSPLNQLNSSYEIKQIVMKLPFKMRDRWRTNVYYIAKQGRQESFRDLAEFVHEQAEILSSPIYGNIVGSSQEKYPKKENQFEAKKKVLATASNEEKKSYSVCSVCKKNNHEIADCFFLKKKNYEEKCELIRKEGLCFNCLIKGHQRKDCRRKVKCQICQRSHLTIMHNPEYTKKQEKKSEDSNKNKEEKEDPKSSSDKNQEKPKAALMVLAQERVLQVKDGLQEKTLSPIVPVRIRVKGANKWVNTYAALDSHCSDVFMSQELAEKLSCQHGKSTSLSITTLVDKCFKTPATVVENLEIMDLEENESALISVAYAHKNWPFDCEDSPKPIDISEYPYLVELPFNFIKEKIGLLVGMNYPGILQPLEIVRGPTEDHPYATRHKFGWAFNGPIKGNEKKFKKCFRTTMNMESNTQFQALCAREFDDLNPTTQEPSIEDKKWQVIVEKTLKQRQDGLFEVALPFRDENIYFPNNKFQAMQRLVSSKRKLSSDQDYFNEYSEFMNTMLNKGYAEKVPESELVKEQGKIWYLVHFGVRHKQKKKLRIVFDASLAYKGTSLNQALLQGPDLANNLTGVLLRAREQKVLITADIEKMFYSVKVTDEHKDYLRFLWYPNNDLTCEPHEYRVTVHIFGATSSPAIANYLLKYSACTQEAKNTFSIEARNSVQQNFYVDDWSKSLPSEKLAIEMAKEVLNLVLKVGFRLTGFASNSRVVLDAIDPGNRAGVLKDLELKGTQELPTDRTLGVIWNMQLDNIEFKINLPEKPSTKRGVLATVFSIYDILGLAAPAILPAKKIFQLACDNKLQWDDELPSELKTEWNHWRENISKLSSFAVPRCMQMSARASQTELHVFCDGSEQAYAAVAYLRTVSDENEPYCNIIMAKTRLVPLKTTAVTTIPRIELNGAKLAVLLSNIITRELTLKISKIFYWTDSTVVLKYISNETRRFQRFVANRVAFIRVHSCPEQWRHVPTDCNPADLASRGIKYPTSENLEIWQKGPKFLWKTEEFWPAGPVLQDASVNDLEIIKQKPVLLTEVKEITPTETYLNATSSWDRLKIRVAWLIVIQENWKNKDYKITKLSIGLLRRAELKIWMYVQQAIYGKEIELLSGGKSLPAKNRIKNLDPYIDEKGMLRVRGRLGLSNFLQEYKYPIILSHNHNIVELYVSELHLTFGHMGQNFLIAELRKKLWIVHATALVRKIVKRCIGCRKRQGRPSEQLMSDLPADRLTPDEPPFNRIGIDAFGPFLVTRKRSAEKRYGLIFTCLNSRATHIEVLFTLTADSFIQALTRFLARRGPIQVIRCDQGTNFVAADKELKESIKKWNSKKIEDALLQKNIEFKFNPPGASHHGGVWERQIRTIRKVLSGLTKEQAIKFSDESLATLFCEVESILNNRPLCPTSNNPNDYDALTPNHLLQGRAPVTFPIGLFDKNDSYMQKKWRQVQYLVELFWTRWKKEYIPILQERQKWVLPKRSHREGDLVLVIDILLPRNQWPLGRIEKIYEDSLGRVRKVDVKISRFKGEVKGKVSIIQRPISKLILLREVENL